MYVIGIIYISVINCLCASPLGTATPCPPSWRISSAVGMQHTLGHTTAMHVSAYVLLTYRGRPGIQQLPSRATPRRHESV
jgi:hypothetical protein